MSRRRRGQRGQQGANHHALSSRAQIVRVWSGATKARKPRKARKARTARVAGATSRKTARKARAVATRPCVSFGARRARAVRREHNKTEQRLVCPSQFEPRAPPPPPRRLRRRRVQRVFPKVRARFVRPASAAAWRVWPSEALRPCEERVFHTAMQSNAAQSETIRARNVLLCSQTRPSETIRAKNVCCAGKCSRVSSGAMVRQE